MDVEKLLPEEVKKDTGFLMWKLDNLWQRSLKKEFEEIKLTHCQFILLKVVEVMSEQKKTTQSMISIVSQIDPMTTSTVIRNLQKRNLVVRKTSKTDTRTKEIELTDEGKELIRKADERLNLFCDNFFKHIENKEEFNNQLNKLLEANNLNLK